MIRARGVFLAIALAFLPAVALAQAVLQAGPITPGHAPAYIGAPGQQTPILADSGGAGGTSNQGLIELLLTMPQGGQSSPPYAGTGTGILGTNFCDNDAPVSSVTGYHYLCFSPNADGGGLILYGAAGNATPLPFQIVVNGSAITFSSTTKGSVSLFGSAPVSVSAPAVTANSQVTFTLKTPGGSVGSYPTILTITPGSGFTVNGATGDTSTYNYLITG